MTIMLHINYLILCYADSSITTKYIKLLDDIYGLKDPLTVTRGKNHEYLGMTINFTLKIGCSIAQYDFVKKMWKDLDKGLKSLYRNNLAADFLFKVNTKAEVLTQKRKEEYYKTTAKCIWLSQRS